MVNLRKQWSCVHGWWQTKIQMKSITILYHEFRDQLNPAQARFLNLQRNILHLFKTTGKLMKYSH